MPREEPIRTNTCLMELPSTPAKNPPAVGVEDVVTGITRGESVRGKQGFEGNVDVNGGSPGGKMKVEGARRVWGTLSVCTSAVI